MILLDKSIKLQDLNNYKFIDNHHLQNEKIHLVISGGAFSGFYGIGLGYIINNCIKSNIIEYSGTSGGALNIVCIACNINYSKWQDCYYIIKNDINNSKTLMESIYNAANIHLPENAHEICNLKLQQN
jgi:predicted acylesterase/phospholipase RssA